jgi:hypothetical protein
MPAVAEPLAALLDVLAARLQPDGQPGVLDQETTRAAVAVAVLRAAVPPAADGPAGP